MDNTLVDCHLRRKSAAVIDRLGSGETSAAADAEERDWPTVACIPRAELLEYRYEIEHAYRLAKMADKNRLREIGELGELSSSVASLAV